MFAAAPSSNLPQQQQAHVMAKLANQRHPFGIDSREYQELEGRLDNTLSRIAMETQEIKQLEQQLTDGQILVNQALQMDLQGIISGIQNYLGGLREQVRQAKEEAHSLDTHNQTLQQQLTETKLYCRQLESEARRHKQHVHGGLDQLLGALVSGLDCFSPCGVEDMLSDRLRQIYQEIQQYVADQTRRAKEQVQQEQVQQSKERQIHEERLRQELQQVRKNLQDSETQVQQLQHSMAAGAPGPSRRQKAPLDREGHRLSSSRSESQQIRWTTQQLRLLFDTIEQLDAHTQQVTSVGSQGTRDSGLGLHYLSSPDRGRCDRRPPTEGDHMVGVNLTHTGDSGGGSNAAISSSEDRGEGCGLSSLGPDAGLSAGLAHSQEPSVSPGGQLCGCPAAVYYTPSAGGAVLHCNIHDHRHLIDRLEGKRRVEEEGMKLRLKMKQLRCDCLWEEVQCVEKTLLKRRAELRQADRLLLDAQSCLHNTKIKARCVQKQLASSQTELEELEHRIQKSATSLLDTKHQLREMQEEQEKMKN